MGFTMQFWINAERIRKWLVMLLLPLAIASSFAAEGDLPAMRVYQQGASLMLDASLSIDMPEATEAVLRKGVPLAVVQDVKLVQSRWYWQDAVLARVHREWVLSYQALTQKWRVMSRDGEQVQQFETAADAWQYLATMKAWPIASVPQLGALRDAEAELTWSLERRSTDASTNLTLNDAGAAWRFRIVGRVAIPTTMAPVRDALNLGAGQ